MKKITVLFCLLLSLGWQSESTGDQFCGLRNLAFQEGENITFNVFYSVIGIYINAGSANFSVSAEQLNNKPVYHVVGSGSSNPSYDWIFKVRDKYESFIDTGSLQPLKFLRDINEGGFKKTENITFNHKTGTAVTTDGVFKVLFLALHQ